MTTAFGMTSIEDDAKARRNAFVLAAAQALAGAMAPINFALGAIVGHSMLGEDKSLATFPVTSFVIGTAIGTVPAALLMRRIGRRPGLIAGMLIGSAGGLVNTHAVMTGAFLQLCLGAFMMGFAAAFVQQFRFAAVDRATPAFRPKAISYVLVGGILAAIIGPQTAIHAQSLIASVPFAGAYLGAALLSLGAALVLFWLDIPQVVQISGATRGRPLLRIAAQPTFLIAVGCAVSAYALMAFVMTAAPLAMVLHNHHQDMAFLGIQWHVMAMYGPSFFTGSLIVRYGAERIVATGLILLVGTAIVALAGTSIPHFWVALILLGIGWNFGFIGGTALVTETYRPVEKERVQALNDFLVFGFVALASFSSGKVLVAGSWELVNIVVLPVALTSLSALIWRMRRRPRTA